MARRKGESEPFVAVHGCPGAVTGPWEGVPREEFEALKAEAELYLARWDACARAAATLSLALTAAADVLTAWAKSGAIDPAAARRLAADMRQEQKRAGRQLDGAAEGKGVPKEEFERAVAERDALIESLIAPVGPESGFFDVLVPAKGVDGLYRVVGAYQTVCGRAAAVTAVRRAAGLDAEGPAGGEGVGNG